MEQEQINEQPSKKIIRRKKGQISKRQGGEAAGKPKLAAVKTPAPASNKPSYIKLTDDNRRWVAEKAYKTGHNATTVVNAAITAARGGKKFMLDNFTPKYLAKALESRDRRKESFKKQAGL